LANAVKKIGARGNAVTGATAMMMSLAKRGPSSQEKKTSEAPEDEALENEGKAEATEIQIEN
jgi:hypothetical protein